MAVIPLCAGARKARGWWVAGVLAVIVCSFTGPASARTWVVRPGGSIQGAIDRAGDAALPGPVCDVTGDGVVDVADLLEFLDCFVMAR